MSAPTARRIPAAFAAAAAEQRPVVIPYLTVGFPSLGETVDLVLAAREGGADLVELGLPFSDPLADGPVIQSASQRALKGGASVERALELAAAIRQRSDVPLLFMGYYNPMLRFGLDRFIHVMSEAGVDGLIVPDLPLEESEEFRRLARGSGVSIVQLIAPTTPEERIKLLDEASTDFSYSVSLVGVTGARERLGDELPAYLDRVGRLVKKPFVVGFGISRPEQMRTLVPPAAGVVVGSALLGAIDAAGSPAERIRVVRDFVRGFAGPAGRNGASA